jgi:DNA-binding transcriptional ArsR family regulator
MIKQSAWNAMSTRRPEARLRASAPIFAALGDETRLRLVTYLSAAGPSPTSTLTASVDVTRQAVMKHLHVMRDAGLVRSVRQGRGDLWQIESAQLAEAQRCLELVSARWDQAIGRLQALVEDE